jgi:hypothetical protein
VHVPAMQSFYYTANKTKIIAYKYIDLHILFLVWGNNFEAVKKEKNFLNFSSIVLFLYSTNNIYGSKFVNRQKRPVDGMIRPHLLGTKHQLKDFTSTTYLQIVKKYLQRLS